MLSMPMKPLKKVRVKQEGQGRYTLTILSPLKSETEFRQMIKNDVVPCLGEYDAFVNPRWETKSLTLIAADVNLFEHELIYRLYIIKRECPC